MSDAPQAVFLSYSSEDATAAKRIAEALRVANIEVWFDQSELVGGDQWDTKIRRQIKECALFIPILSKTTQGRREAYFRLEWKLADERTHLMAKGTPFLLPVTIDGTSDRGALVPDSFLAAQWTKLPGGETPSAFCERVKKLLTPPVAVHVADSGPVLPGTVARHPRRRWPLLLAGAVAVAVAGAWLWLRPPAAEAPRDLRPVAAAAAIEPPAPQVDPQSIAILPFSNISEDPAANAFFADGMHEDILTNLGVVRALRVTSRTSVMQYRATTKPIRQIGRELGVAYVLEGSVRRAGHQVRVTGQLIDARTDKHVWAKSYDRDLTDTFAIQSELSQAIAGALSAAISPQEKALLENRPTTSLAAYDLFVKARAWIRPGSGADGAEPYEQMLIEAVKLDPAFAQAWGYLAWFHVRAVFSNVDHTAERLAKAKAAIETAVRLAPDDPVVIEMQGNYYYYGYRDYVRAGEQFERLLIIRPNSAEAHAQMGFLYRRQGRWVEALAILRRAVQLDPLSSRASGGLSFTLQELHRYNEAATAARLMPATAGFDLYAVGRPLMLQFLANGSTREMDEWLAQIKPAAGDEIKLLSIRRDWARLRGDWVQAVQLDRQHPYLDPDDGPHLQQDIKAISDLMGNGELAAGRARAKEVIPQLNASVEREPANDTFWRELALLHAFAGEQEAALRCSRKMLELVPEAKDAYEGPTNSLAFAQVRAWTGDKDGALAELARLLRTPAGANVHAARVAPGWLPLRGDPRFEALLNDPKNNEPLF